MKNRPELRDRLLLALTYIGVAASWGMATASALSLADWAAGAPFGTPPQKAVLSGVFLTLFAWATWPRKPQPESAIYRLGVSRRGSSRR